MTGGSLPAMTWKKIMAYAHQGVELKQMPGVPPNPGPVGPPVAAEAGARPGDEIPRPTLLTRRGAEILVRIERSLEEASRQLGAKPSGTADNRQGTQSRTGSVAASEGRAPRGN